MHRTKGSRVTLIADRGSGVKLISVTLGVAKMRFLKKSVYNVIMDRL
ncbi:MAG: hypothetical protein LBD37_09020 [Treponema sp.]|nr:hypothetical protein [Treponema sp.]